MASPSPRQISTAATGSIITIAMPKPTPNTREARLSARSISTGIEGASRCAISREIGRFSTRSQSKPPGYTESMPTSATQ